MTPEHAIIARCTRNGVVQWSQVAKQMGVSVETARARHDAGFPCRVTPRPPEPPPRPTVKKPTYRGKSNVVEIRRDIVNALRVSGPLKAKQIYDRLEWSAKTVQSHLSALREVGRIRHERSTALWSLAEASS